MSNKLTHVLLTWYNDSGVQAGQVQLDAAISETHTTTAQITDHQVEVGANISDNIRPMPKKLSLQGIVTNHPIATPSTQMRGIVGVPNGRITTKVRAKQGAIPIGLPVPPMGSVVEKVFDYSALYFASEFDRVRDVYGELTLAQQTGMLFTVTTSLTQYTNMAIENISTPRSAETGNALMLGMDFKEIRFAEVLTVDAIPEAVKIKHTAKKPPAEVTKPEEKATQSTALEVIKNKVSGFISSLGG